MVPEPLIATFELAQRHMGLLAQVTTQDALAEFISSGAYLAHLRRMTRLYKIRRDRMVEALASEAGDRLTVEIPAGGMQLLARCRASVNDQHLAAKLREAGVISRPLSSLFFHKTREQGLFLGFAAWTLDWQETSQGDFLVIGPTQKLGVANMTITGQAF